ncbi:LOW QUALITY PROTEIN: PDXK isoform 13 [Pan troglodytes]|uniref:PDXK isoform 13 n=1 Tax=Pan troglodytes TaxID=9598 RepID=A0A2J8M8E9_PANTR|nr:LOW QUALITY PROTEIN: PDXK isoform 13 [Pan troglodytes]
MGHKARLPAGTRVFHTSCVVGSLTPFRLGGGKADPPSACTAHLAQASPPRGCCSHFCPFPRPGPRSLRPHHTRSFFHTVSWAWQSLHLVASIPSGPFERICWSSLSELPGLRALGRSLRSWRSAGGRVTLSWLSECRARGDGTGALLLGLVVPAAGKGQLV